MLRTFVLCLPLAFATAPLAAAPSGNPQIDYPAFRTLTQDVEAYRLTRLLDWNAFVAAAAEPDVLILDARSERQFAAGHLEGAVNLPLPEFSEEALAEIIGRSDRPILIYCNNNFRNDVPPVALKRIQLALNIQTFVNLVGYGYRNVYELNEVVDFRDPAVGWVTS
jgi:rhodanese-related sulfurtransferase